MTSLSCYNISMVARRNLTAFIVALVMLAPAGCTNKQAAKEPLKPRATVAKIVLADDTKRPFAGSIPKIAGKLGRGSLALVRGRSLEILNPKGQLIASGRLTGGAYVGSWSPEGDALVYFKRLDQAPTERTIMRLLDFSKGKDTAIYWGPEGNAALGETRWARGEVLVRMEKIPERQIQLWSIGREGSTAGQFVPRPVGRQGVIFTDVALTDISRDQKSLLVQLSGRGGTWLGKLDLWNMNTTIVSPPEIRFPGNAVFSPDKDKIAFTGSGDFGIGTEKMTVSDVYVATISGIEQLTRTTPPGLFIHSFSPDGADLVVFKPNEFYSPGSGIYLLNVKSKKLRRLIGSSRGLSPLGFVDNGKGFLVLRQETTSADAPNQLLKIDVATRETKTIAAGVNQAYLAQ